MEWKFGSNTYSFEVALYIPNVSTPTASRIAGRDIEHMVVQPFLVKDTVADDL